MTAHRTDTVSRHCRHKETETETVTRDGEETGTENFTEKKTFTETANIANESGCNPSEGSAVALYEPTDAERQAMKDWNKFRRAHPPLPRMDVSQQGATANIGPEHEDLGTGTALQMHAVSAAYPEYYSGILTAIGNVGTSKGRVSADKIDYLIAMVAGIKPRDQLESMLAVQMAAIHDATMEMAARLKRVDTIPQHDSAERTLNRLARTFAAQIEALKRYRSKGEQRVIVERVNVERGGQAIVGNVAHGEG